MVKEIHEIGREELPRAIVLWELENKLSNRSVIEKLILSLYLEGTFLEAEELCEAIHTASLVGGDS